jgi:hypothetical protein
MAAPPATPVAIDEAERIVSCISMAVEIIRMARVWYYRIRADEAGKIR